MSIKLVACDLDGTLLNSHSKISEENVAAIKRLIKRGIIFVPASGRNVAQIPDDIKNILGIEFLVTVNGSYVINQDNGEVIYRSTMDADMVEEWLLIGKSCGASIMVYTTEGILMDSNLTVLANRPDFYRMKDLIESREKPENIYTYYMDYQPEILKLVLFFSSDRHREDVLGQIKDLSLYEIADSGIMNVEVTGKGVNKAVGIEALIQHLGISPKEVLVIGDSGNDSQMLAMTPYSYAVSNAMDIAKTTANYITVSNDEHVMVAIETVISQINNICV